jgi:hypothetical protein
MNKREEENKEMCGRKRRLPRSRERGRRRQRMAEAVATASLVEAYGGVSLNIN